MNRSQILVVDDDPIMRLMLGRGLRRRGYDVIECADGVEAFRALEGGSGNSLLVLDYEMPKFNGAQVCEIIRTHSNPRIAQTPIILLTAYAGESHEVECLRAGADDFVSKPVNIPVLQARIETHLRVAVLREELQEKNRLLEDWRTLHERDLEAARLVQQAILPPRLPVVPGWEFAARYQSLIQVGGDMYGWLPITGGGTLIWMADATGHGASAALLTTFTQLLFRYSTVEAESPAGVLSGVDGGFRTIFKGNTFMTAACLEIKPGSGVIRTAGAGHPPVVVLRRNGEVEVIASTAPPVGLLYDPHRLENLSATICEGETLLLFTDGLYSLKDRGGEHLPFSRLIAALERLAPESAEDAINQVIARAKSVAGNEVYDDDLAVVAARRLPAVQKED